ncbi:methyltransferase [Marinobacterium arenosum]|uniref:methyltransferase n=1 Tax=Marinobacterium arenosum TaxID=2862496 RepID=UPI001C93A9DE|nr:methyltransferase [Marinobacterium arenosum]MBY4677033.1 methyltransferase [Marinobacterium arenosum]
MQTLVVPQGEFRLNRYPLRPKETLRAWDAADEYLLNYLAEQGLPAQGGRILILNDQFGALSVVLHSYQPVMSSDSYLAHQGARANLAENGVALESVALLDSLSEPAGPFDLVLLKVPKSLAMLEHQLARLRPLLHAGSRVIGAGMVKSIHTSTLKLFDTLLGPTRTSLAQKKARLIFAEPDPDLPPAPDKYPSRYKLEQTDYWLSNHAGVFSRDSLDIGTRFLLQHLPASDAPRHIVDLGCGNGVVGMIAAERNPNATLTFVDESFMAVASARDNFIAAHGEVREARFQATDCLAGIERNSADLILNNPPFHQHNVVGDFIARQMFKEAKQVLKSGGELWVIGNRHLGYHLRLKQLFGNCETVAANRKFVILRACKR